MVELDYKALKLLKSVRNKKFFIKMLKRLENKRIIFTITTGRSGTAYLAGLLSVLDRVASYHEPSPNFAIVMRKVQDFPDIAVRFLFEKKLPFIASIDRPVYCETSHLFCKGFFYPLLELGVLPEFIILKRNRRLVAKSLFELNTIPGRIPLALAFYLKPDDKVYLPIDDWQKLNDYQLCYWYCLEIEKRMEIYSKEIENRGGKVYFVSFEELLDKERAVNFIKSMNIIMDEKTEEKIRMAVGIPVNTKKDIKARKLYEELTEENVLEMEKEVEEIVNRGGL